jgi:hypothetical protein
LNSARRAKRLAGGAALGSMDAIREGARPMTTLEITEAICARLSYGEAAKTACGTECARTSYICGRCAGDVNCQISVVEAMLVWIEAWHREGSLCGKLRSSA